MGMTLEGVFQILPKYGDGLSKSNLKNVKGSGGRILRESKGLGVHQKAARWNPEVIGRISGESWENLGSASECGSPRCSKSWEALDFLWRHGEVGGGLSLDKERAPNLNTLETLPITASYKLVTRVEGVRVGYHPACFHTVRTTNPNFSIPVSDKRHTFMPTLEIKP